MDRYDVDDVYVYNGVSIIPMDVTHVRVDPSVSVIPEAAFADRDELEFVELPEGLISIGDYAFRDCTSLKMVKLPSTVTEIGFRAFESCRSLQRVEIPSNIQKIQQGCFLFCHGLVEVVLPEGLLEIEQDAFSFCTSMVSVTFPSSLNVVGIGSFERCKVLNEIHMYDSIESIEASAFRCCNIANFRIPPHMVDVDTNILMENKGLVSVEISENATAIECLLNSNSLRNIAFPSNCTMNATGLGNLKDLGVVFPDDDYDDNDMKVVATLQNRFNDLPIHKICYYQSYHDNETTIQHLKREINWTSKFPGQLNTTGKQQDFGGMTPLHILACSTKPTIEMYQLLIEKYPETLIMKDKWGDVPLLYAIWCNAPSEVIDLLVESYKSLHPDYDFDWSGMIQTLAKRAIPLKNIQNLVNTQQNNFPDQKYDMQQVVMELAAFDTQQYIMDACTLIETFRYLLQLSITERLDFLDIAKWRIDLENSINALPDDVAGRERHAQSVYDKLAIYESIKEGTSVLELALWKAKVNERHNKRPRVDREDTSYKEQCRINCGADIIIRNVLSYLLPKKVVIPSDIEEDEDKDWTSGGVSHV